MQHSQARGPQLTGANARVGLRVSFQLLSHAGAHASSMVPAMSHMLGETGQALGAHLVKLGGSPGTLLGWKASGIVHGEGQNCPEAWCKIRFDTGETHALPMEDCWILPDAPAAPAPVPLTAPVAPSPAPTRAEPWYDLAEDPELKWALELSMQEAPPKQPTQLEKLLGDQVAEVDLAYLVKCTETWCEDRMIGEGAYGKVYKGVDPDDGEAARFAVKRQWCSDDDIETRQRLERMNRAEIDTLTRITHPNIIRLLGYSKGQEDMVLIYEFGEQGSLESALQEDALAAKLDWALRVRIARGILAGVQHLHKQQFYHRDVKPSNIVLMEDFAPKLNDFGLSRSFREAESSDEVPEGTPEFMCRQYVSTRKFDEKSEVYAIGVTILQ